MITAPVVTKYALLDNAYNEDNDAHNITIDWGFLRSIIYQDGVVPLPRAMPPLRYTPPEGVAMVGSNKNKD
jgi:hypothetical protein